MKLVIDIPEEIVESVKYGNVYIAGTRNNGKTILCKITKAIANATPLTDCTDAISREDAIQALTHFDDSLKRLHELPSVNPTRPKADVLDKIRAEIDKARFIDKDTMTCKNALASGLGVAMKIIDKYKAESNSEMLVCPACGLDVHSHFKTCPRCGAEMESE